jgi:hypothetical protein
MENSSPLTSNRWIWLAIALTTIIVLTLITAPNRSQSAGSTYSRAPDGYGAWYAFMEKRGTPVKRWQRPQAELFKSTDGKRATLLRIHSGLTYPFLSSAEEEWIGQNNNLVILGIGTKATTAPFKTQHSTDAGQVLIETKRRLLKLKNNEKEMLGDRYGTIIWREKFGQGQVIFVNTPYLAANAYQDSPGNYEFLAQLVSSPNQSTWVDEYLHGYKDKEVINREVAENWLGYLGKTPLLAALLQIGIILVVIVLAENHRLGTPNALTVPRVNNSIAYIQALAGVLQKAETNELILETVGRAEQLHLQTALGLGTTPVDGATLLSAWVERTGQPAHELEQFLKPYWRRQRLREEELIKWLGQIPKLRQSLHHHETENRAG